MTAALPLTAKERGGPTLVQQVLCHPVTDEAERAQIIQDFVMLNVLRGTHAAGAAIDLAVRTPRSALHSG